MKPAEVGIVTVATGTDTIEVVVVVVLSTTYQAIISEEEPASFRTTYNRL